LRAIFESVNVETSINPHLTQPNLDITLLSKSEPLPIAVTLFGIPNTQNTRYSWRPWQEIIVV